MNPYSWFVPISRVCLVAVAILSVSESASADWKEKVLYSFKAGADGRLPQGGVVLDSAGNLYGTTSESGSEGCPSSGCGTVFEISPPTEKDGKWTETILYTFQGISDGKTDGAVPVGGVIIDEKGNLYGTTAYGGSGPCKLSGSTTGCGIVYELSPPPQKGGQWTHTILHNFQGGNDGQFPWGDLVFDNKGNLYGATQFGGGKGTTCDPFYQYCGTVFELNPPTTGGGKWKEKVLHRFVGVASGQQLGDGADPNGGLVLDSKGSIYGTTYFGGSVKGECNGGSGGTGCGTVFEIIPPAKKDGAWAESVIYRFNGSDGATPAAGIIFNGTGHLYGTAFAGANNGDGAVFELVAPKEGQGPWKETMLCRFKDGSDGENPRAGLTLHTDGNLYGATYAGSAFSGTVFRLTPPKDKGDAWTLGILHGFTGSPDGAQPAANLIFDKEGNFYSTTQLGGTGGCTFGCGTIFEVFP